MAVDCRRDTPNAAAILGGGVLAGVIHLLRGVACRAGHSWHVSQKGEPPAGPRSWSSALANHQVDASPVGLVR